MACNVDQRSAEHVVTREFLGQRSTTGIAAGLSAVVPRSFKEPGLSLV